MFNFKPALKATLNGTCHVSPFSIRQSKSMSSPEFKQEWMNENSSPTGH